MPSTTVITIIEEVARRLAALRKGTATAGAAASITVDDDPQFRTNRTNANQLAGYTGAEFVSTGGTLTVPVNATIGAHVWSTGVMTPSIDFTTPPDNTTTFDLFLRGITRANLVDALNSALRIMRYVDRTLLSYIDDADMEVTGTSSHTQVGSATLSKVAGRSGRLALRVANSAAGDAARSIIMEVDPKFTARWLIAAECRAEVGTARLTAYDETNSADIDTEDWTSRGWGYVWKFITLPATCERLSVRLLGVGTSDIAEWDNVTVLPIGVTEMHLPAFIDNRQQVLRIYKRQLNNRLDRPRWQRYFWADIRPNQSSQGVSPEFAPSPYMVSLSPPVTHPIFLDVQRPYPSVSVNADTTFAPRLLVEQYTIVELLKDLSSRSPGQETASWASRLDDEKKVLNRMVSTAREPITIDYGFSSPPNTPITRRGY